MGKQYTGKMIETSASLSRRLSAPHALEEQGLHGIAGQLLLVGSLFVLSVILWGSFAQISELVRADGQIIRTGRVHLIQHLEGGIIDQIQVSEGDLVANGQVIVQLQSSLAESELSQLVTREEGLVIRMERLSALLENRDMNPEIVKGNERFFREEQKTLETQRLADQTSRDGLVAIIEQRQADMTALSERQASLTKQLALLTEQVDMRETLLEKGLVSRVAYLESRRVTEQTQGESNAVSSQLVSVRGALSEAEATLRQRIADVQNEAQEEKGKLAGQLAEIRSSIRQYEDRADRLAVRAPQHGIVQSLVVSANGEVVQPGGTIAEIIPLDELVAEVKISPDDIGHIAVGHSAQVKITTYDPARYGPLNGEIRRISATTFKREKTGEPYYKVLVGFSELNLDKTQTPYRLIPGMVVNAEILVGAKSLVRYFLKPVYRSFDNAFTER